MKKLNKKYTKQLQNTIKRGGLVVMPTDTVYGLVCDARNKEAVRKIFKIKRRPKGKPISIFVRDLKMAKRFAKINKNQEEFLKKVWPGALTAVLRPDVSLPEVISQGKNTIGVRVPDSRFIIDLISKTGQPLAETSANISGQPATTKIKDVLEQFEKEKMKPDLILDAGNLKKARPSTVLDLTSKEPKILREGKISEKNLLNLQPNENCSR